MRRVVRIKRGGIKTWRGRGAGHPAVTVEIVGRSDLGRHMAGRQQTHGLPTRCIVILDQLMVHSTTTSTSTTTNQG